MDGDMPCRNAREKQKFFNFLKTTRLQYRQVVQMGYDRHLVDKIVCRRFRQTGNSFEQVHHLVIAILNELHDENDIRK